MDDIVALDVDKRNEKDWSPKDPTLNNLKYFEVEVGGNEGEVMLMVGGQDRITSWRSAMVDH